jgi:hypothetical protein
MPVFLPAFPEERRHGRRRGNLKGRSTDGSGSGAFLAPHYTSVVLLRGEPLVPEVRGSALLGALQDCEAELNQGAIVTLDWTDKPRARVLPLR